MNMKQVEKLLEQACRNCEIEVECPVCQAIMTAEPDAEDLYCEECERVTMKNPLIELGLI